MLLSKRTIWKYSLAFLLIVPIIFSGCYRVPDKLEPQVNYTVQDKYLKQLPSPFPPLSAAEKSSAWGKEYLIGQKFAAEIDLYRAVTTFKRAQFLLSPTDNQRLQEIEYQIIFSYYLGKRYEEAVQSFEGSTLYQTARPSFPAYHDLLILLYESYLQTNQPEKAHHILCLIHRYYPKTKAHLDFATALIDGDLATLCAIAATDPSKSYVTNLLTTYENNKKSIAKAQTLNALIPGGGYLYVGQTQSAITAFLLNGLFIAAAVHFFSKGQLAAGIIATSFEAGWYFGGIYGAGEAAKLYNERLYESYAYPTLNSHKLFPVLMLKYGF